MLNPYSLVLRSSEHHPHPSVPTTTTETTESVAIAKPLSARLPEARARSKRTNATQTTYFGDTSATSPRFKLRVKRTKEATDVKTKPYPAKRDVGKPRLISTPNWREKMWNAIEHKGGEQA